jgi:hypothetical protein
MLEATLVDATRGVTGHQAGGTHSARSRARDQCGANNPFVETSRLARRGCQRVPVSV